MKIVVLDGYTLNPSDLSWGKMQDIADVMVYDRTDINNFEQIVKRIGDSDIVITNKTPISKEVLDRCTNIQYIGILATGYNVVDTKYAREKNIPVCNIPTYGTKAVAQFAIAMLLEICHNIGHHSKAVYHGRWESCEDWCFWDHPLIELSGKTLGVVGFGKIGRETASLAQAFGMKILAYDNYKDKTLESDTLKYVELNELFQNSDVISLHCPLQESTLGIINKNNISKMKNGVIILNNSRGQLIVEQDLADALNNEKVYAAAVDVVSTEPIKSDNPLLKAKNCFITPHIAWAPIESRSRLMDVAVDNIKDFLSGSPKNVVN